MLPLKHRLTRRADFERVYAASRPFSVPGLSLRFSANGSDMTRFGIVISKKTAPLAIRRNRLKRILREALRPLAGEISPGLDIVLNCQKDCPEDLAAAATALRTLLRKSKLLK